MRPITTLLAAAGLSLAFAAAPALANECPKHIKAIDETLSKGGMDASKMSQAKELRDEGQKLHNDGKHTESMQKLTQAEQILGIKSK